MASSSERQLRKPRPTAQDVANLAGVSRSAVSRAFTPGASISADLKERISAAATKLRYVPHPIARSLMTRRSNVIAIVVSNLSSAVYQRMLELFNEQLNERGYSVFLVTAMENGDNARDYLQMLNFPVDGVIVTAAGSLSFSQTVCRQCMDMEVPVVTLNRTLNELPVSSVNCDHYEGGALAAKLLYEKGWRKPAIVAGEEWTTVNVRRVAGFSETIRSLGLPQAEMAKCGFSFEGGYAASIQLLSQNPDIDSLFCVNDMLAIGAMEAARNEGLRKVPDELSIVGFDNIPAASWPSYQLTSVNQRLDEMVRETIAVLFDHMSGSTFDPIHRTIPVELVSRASVVMKA